MGNTRLSKKLKKEINRNAQRAKDLAAGKDVGVGGLALDAVKKKRFAPFSAILAVAGDKDAKKALGIKLREQRISTLRKRPKKPPVEKVSLSDILPRFTRGDNK